MSKSLSPTLKSTRCTSLLAFVVVTVMSISGCGLTCELQGVPTDYPDCDAAVAASSERNLTGQAKADLEECIADSCDLATAE